MQITGDYAEGVADAHKRMLGHRHARSAPISCSLTVQRAQEHTIGQKVLHENPEDNHRSLSAMQRHMFTFIRLAKHLITGMH